MTNLLPFRVCARLLLASVALPPMWAERCEVNEVRREDGEVRFCQTVLWSRQDGSMQRVTDWTMSDKTHVIPRGRGAVVLWHDNFRVSRVVAERLDITRTVFDCEEEDRWVLPVDERQSVFEGR